MNERLKNAIFKKSVKDYQGWFDILAHEILNNHTFRIRNSLYEITEIEFYIYDENHPDANSHATPMQKTILQMAFHTHGSSFKEGSYKGVDISLGHKKRFGGILIRGLKSLKDKRMIDGPSKVVDEILLQFKETKVRELIHQVDGKIGGRDFEFLPSNETVQTIFKCPRVGLSLKKNPEQKIPYLLKNYRYLKYPELSKKGRPFIIASAIVHNIQLPLSKKIRSAYSALLKKGEKKKTFHLTCQSSVSEFIEYYGHLSCKDINDNP